MVESHIVFFKRYFFGLKLKIALVSSGKVSFHQITGGKCGGGGPRTGTRVLLQFYFYSNSKFCHGLCLLRRPTTPQ